MRVQLTLPTPTTRWNCMFTYSKGLNWNALKFSKIYLLIADHSFQIYCSVCIVFIVSICVRHTFVWLLKLCTILGSLVIVLRAMFIIFGFKTVIKQLLDLVFGFFHLKCIIEQLLDSVFMIWEIINVPVRVIILAFGSANNSYLDIDNFHITINLVQ